MQCPSCGASLPVEDLDCPRCGAGVGWWVKPHGGAETGPFTFLQMQELTRRRRLGPLDRVRIGLVGEWVPAPDMLSPKFQRQPPARAPAAPPPRAGLARIAFGVAFGLVALVLLVGCGLLVLARRARVSSDPQAEVCAGNLMRLSRALALYAQDHGGFPPWESWVWAAGGRAPGQKPFLCPADPKEPGYAYNATLCGWYPQQVARPDRCVLLWDAGALGPSVGLSAAGEAARHRRGDNYAFVGGHVSWRPRGRYPPADVDLQPLRADQ